MKKAILATFMVLLASTAQAQTLQQKIDDAVARLTAAYSASHAATVTSYVDAQIDALDDRRYGEVTSQVGWRVNGVNYPTATFQQAIQIMASDNINAINRYQYQVNSRTGQTRIRLFNRDGSIFGTGDGWIYAYNVNELIVGLAGEAYEEGFEDGFANGYRIGYDDGYRDGFIDGYDRGYDQAECDYGRLCRTGHGR